MNVRPTRLAGVRSSVTVAAAVRADLAFEVSGVALLARESDGLITSNIGLTADFEGEGLEWSYVQSLIRWDVVGDLSLLAGVRWDHTTVRFHVTRPSISNDDFIANSYIPLIGLQVCQDSPAAHVSLRLLGFPAVPGNLKFHTWTENFDIFSGKRSGFLRWVLHGSRSRVRTTDSRPGGCLVVRTLGSLTRGNARR